MSTSPYRPTELGALNPRPKGRGTSRILVALLGSPIGRRRQGRFAGSTTLYDGTPQPDRVSGLLESDNWIGDKLQGSSDQIDRPSAVTLTSGPMDHLSSPLHLWPEGWLLP